MSAGARVRLLVCAGLCEINRTCSEEWDDSQWTQLRRQLCEKDKKWKEWRREEGEEERGRDGKRATHCGGQSALTATGAAEWDLSRLDRWTDRATPRWQTLALDASVSEETRQRALADSHIHLDEHDEMDT